MKELQTFGSESRELIQIYSKKEDMARYLPQPPVFTNKLPEVITIQSDEELLLSASVKALPQAEVKWNLNGFEIRSSRGITLLNEKNHSTLIIQQPVKDGLYAVTASNDLGMSTMATRVYIIKEYSKDNNIMDENKSLQNQRTTPPEIIQNSVTVTTSHDDWEIVDEIISNKSSTESFETIKAVDLNKIEDMRLHDETPKPAYKPGSGILKKNADISISDFIPCPYSASQAKIYEGSKKFSVPITKSIEPFPKRPFIVRQLEPDIFVKKGEKLILESVVDSYPVSRFQWYHNNFEIKPSPNVYIDDTVTNRSEATFYMPTSGIYKVIASNQHGSCSNTTRVTTEIIEEIIEETGTYSVQATKTTPFYKLIKKPMVKMRNDLPMPPKIIRKLLPVTRIEQNGSLTLEISVEAIPEASITWRLNNFEIRPSASTSIERISENVSRITFLEAIDGRVEAIAKNYLGQDSTSTKILIEYPKDMNKVAQSYPLTFIVPLAAELLISDTTKETKLMVTVRAQRPVTFQWFANGESLNHSTDHQFVNDDYSSILIIKPNLLIKQAFYAVEASNDQGSIWCESLIKPHLPIPSKTIKSEVSTSVWQKAPYFTQILTSLEIEEGQMFTANVAIKDGCSPCEFFWSLNGRDVRTFPGILIDSTSYESSLTINSISWKMDGKLSVTAKNKYGSAVSSGKITLRESKYR